MNWFTKLLTFLTPPPTKVDEVVKRKILKQAVKEATVKLDKFDNSTKTHKRARKKGKYVADNKSTPKVNEAWVGGKAPKKKPAKKVVKITTQNIGE